MDETLAPGGPVDTSGEWEWRLALLKYCTSMDVVKIGGPWRVVAPLPSTLRLALGALSALAGRRMNPLAPKTQ